MNRLLRSLLQILAVVAFAIALFRFFPVVAAFVEGAALGIREFWWVILGLVLTVWLFIVFRSRNSD